MRTVRGLFVVAIVLSSSVPVAGADAPAADPKAPAAEVAVEWRQVDVKDVPLEAKKALIAECDKLVGGDEVKGFTYFQTTMDAKETRFKAEFTVGAKDHVVICTRTGEVTAVQSTAQAPAPAAK
ncbi:MAG: hypothetical protein H0V44_01590 [Planctomycetes bacterium]|nr:hypothetical protein [Planctomycetota bacterium]